MEMLSFPLLVLCYQVIVLVSVLIVKLLMGSFDTKSDTIKLDDVAPSDNHYTVEAARHHADAAIANQKAAEANLQVAQIRSKTPEDM